MRSLHIGPEPTSYDGDDSTRVFAVIGHPVRQSLSPVFQNAALRTMQLAAVYVPIDIPPAALTTAVQRMRAAARAGTLAGVNVTMPHKIAIATHLDRLDEQATAVGAVNTVCFEWAGDDVQLEGCNTDVDGILAALEDEGVAMRASRVLILGAGGAARAAVWAALRAGASEICVAARDMERARRMLEDVVSHGQAPTPAVRAIALDEVQAALRSARVLIQTTPVGLKEGDPRVADLTDAPPDLFVLDLIYQRETELLRAARRAGLRAAGGLGMLVHQGAQSLRMWTHTEPPWAVMMRSVEPRS